MSTTNTLLFSLIWITTRINIIFCAIPTISLSPSSVSVPFGQPTNITCTAYLVYTGDIVWQAASTTFWINNNYLSTFGLQYAVSSTYDSTNQTTTSTLTVLSVSSTSTISYECSCNTYTTVTGCTSATIGTASVTGYTTTTTSTILTTTTVASEACCSSSSSSLTSYWYVWAIVLFVGIFCCLAIPLILFYYWKRQKKLERAIKMPMLAPGNSGAPKVINVMPTTSAMLQPPVNSIFSLNTNQSNISNRALIPPPPPPPPPCIKIDSNGSHPESKGINL